MFEFLGTAWPWPWIDEKNIYRAYIWLSCGYSMFKYGCMIAAIPSYFVTDRGVALKKNELQTQSMLSCLSPTTPMDPAWKQNFTKAKPLAPKHATAP